MTLNEYFLGMVEVLDDMYDLDFIIEKTDNNFSLVAKDHKVIIKKIDFRDEEEAKLYITNMLLLGFFHIVLSAIVKEKLDND